MKKYEIIESLCLRYKEITKYLIDEYLIYYCAELEQLEPAFKRKTNRFRHIINKMPKGWYAFLLSQYIAYQLFKEDGYAKKYLSHPAILSRSEEEKNLIKTYVRYPWRYTFCFVRKSPYPNFFDMIDPFTTESFLLYSPSIENISQSHQVTLYFLLIQFNGSCWETYGPIVDFTSLTISDVLFYARQFRPEISHIEEIPEVIENNPIPFSMLHIGANIPLIFHKEKRVVMSRMEFLLDDFVPEEHSDVFEIEKKKFLNKLSLRGVDGFPDFAAAYYSKNEKSIMLTAMTDYGFDKLTDYFEELGYELPFEDMERVSPGILHVIEEILGWKINFIPYEKNFEKKENNISKTDQKKINKFINKLIEDLNSGVDSDIGLYAEQCELDKESAFEIAATILSRFNKTKD
ncbi:MAG TPA: hypothetical protein ENO01_01490 [Candidatus Marinimicrobia bacterium]|nr:hypothetical protein [Candidatus Neomarinimicrobiota bacterium]